MSDEMKLLKAFIDAAGYDITVIWRHPSSGERCDPPYISEEKDTRNYKPQIDYEVNHKARQIGEGY